MVLEEGRLCSTVYKKLLREQMGEKGVGTTQKRQSFGGLTIKV
jgi:hypothetical protein